MKHHIEKAQKWTHRHIRDLHEKLRIEPEMTPFEKTWRRIATVGLVALTTLLISSFLYFLVLLISFDPLAGVPRDSTLILDRNGGLLYTIHGEENRKTIDSLDAIAPHLVNATLAIEDDNFYHHIGIDIPGLIKAVLSQVGIGGPRGGSTITQQFVRNGYLNLERSYARKFREIMMSFVLELKFSKDEILLMYLNEIPYGNNAYGIELASTRYFGKHATELTLGESAVLASIPDAPTRYSPYGAHKYSALTFEPTTENLAGRKLEDESDLEWEEYSRGLIGKTYLLPDGKELYLKGRSDLVLDRMKSLEMISEVEYETALKEIQSMEFTPYKETILAPHFVMWVKQQLEEKYGKEIVEQGGLKVTTTLDAEFQKAAEASISERIEQNRNSYDSTNAALVSVQPSTGQIVAMVGSADFSGEHSEEIDGQVNMITSYRAPGSAFKPFVYALALLNQYTPATVLYDVQTSFGTWKPRNYDDKFKGPMTLRSALGQSRNIPAVKAYVLGGQAKALVPFAEKFGFNTLREQNDVAEFGASLALGAANVTPLEMAEAYGVFANGGVRVEPTAILKIETVDGNVLEQWDAAKVEKTQVLDSQVAYLINDILSDPSVNIGPNVYMEALDNAAKTGTSTDDETGHANNGWIAAYTPSLVTIGWSGNSDGHAMNAAGEAYYTIAPIWKAYMGKVINRLEATAWSVPDGIKEVAVSTACGTLPGATTPSEVIRTEVFASFAVPTEVDDCYKKVRVETLTGRLATDYSPESVVEEKVFLIHKEQWSNWQSDIDKWVSGQEDLASVPLEYAEDIHNAETAAKAPLVSIVDPSSLSSINTDERTKEIFVEIASAENGLKEVTYYLNGAVQYHSTKDPYSGTVRFPANATPGDILTITAEALDIYGYTGSSTIELEVVDTISEENPPSEDDPMVDPLEGEEA